MEYEHASVPECTHTHTHTHTYTQTRITAGGSKKKEKIHRLRSRVRCVSLLVMVPTWFPLGKRET